MKMKGITLNSTTAKRLNFNTMRTAVKAFLRGNLQETEIVENRIQRRDDRTIVTAPLRKKFRVVYDKRQLIRGGFTLPFGY